MKKTLLITAFSVFAFAFASCSGSTTTTEEGTTTSTETEGSASSEEENGASDARTITKSYGPQEFKTALFEAQLKVKKAQVIDVRTAEEFQVSSIKTSINIDVNQDDFKTKVEALDKRVPTFVYCKSGGRSAKAMDILKEMGFQVVYNLEGGIEGWRSAGYELVMAP